MPLCLKGTRWAPGLSICLHHTVKIPAIYNSTVGGEVGNCLLMEVESELDLFLCLMFSVLLRCPKFVTGVNSFSDHNNPMRWAPL